MASWLLVESVIVSGMVYLMDLKSRLWSDIWRFV